MCWDGVDKGQFKALRGQKRENTSWEGAAGLNCEDVLDSRGLEWWKRWQDGTCWCGLSVGDAFVLPKILHTGPDESFCDQHRRRDEQEDDTGQGKGEGLEIATKASSLPPHHARTSAREERRLLSLSPCLFICCEYLTIGPGLFAPLLLNIPKATQRQGAEHTTPCP